MSLAGRVAIVTGASRGIGRECVLALAREGCHVVLVAKSTAPQPQLPGSLYTVAAEVEALGAQALPFPLDLRDAERCADCVRAAIERWGRVDILVNNASALWWHSIVDTPLKKYDLITSINTRGAFAMTQACLPHMRRQGFGRVVTMSPPVSSDVRLFDAKTAYNISKMGMTMVALGVAAEGRKFGVSANSLWPATVVESFASINFKLGEPSNWRKATILSDCVVKLACEPDDFTGDEWYGCASVKLAPGRGSKIRGEVVTLKATASAYLPQCLLSAGHMLIDDEYLRARHGYTDGDFVKYRVDPNVEPPRLLAETSAEWSADFKRGDVKKVAQDATGAKTSKL